MTCLWVYRTYKASFFKWLRPTSVRELQFCPILFVGLRHFLTHNWTHYSPFFELPYWERGGEREKGVYLWRHRCEIVAKLPTVWNRCETLASRHCSRKGEKSVPNLGKNGGKGDYIPSIMSTGYGRKYIYLTALNGQKYIFSTGFPVEFTMHYVLLTRLLEYSVSCTSYWNKCSVP